MQELLAQISYYSNKLFNDKSIRIWYVMLGKNSWKGIVIDTETKTKLIESSVKSNAKSALSSLKLMLESEMAVQKQKEAK